MLIQKKADVNQGNQNLATPLFIAAQQGHNLCLSELISHGAYVSQATADNTTPVFVAAEHGHLSCLRELLEADSHRTATVNQAIVNTGRTALWTAAHHGLTEVVDLLLGAGYVNIFIDLVIVFSNPPLLDGCKTVFSYRGLIFLCRRFVLCITLRLLLFRLLCACEYRADPELGPGGSGALEVADMFGHEAIVKRLQQKSS
jgi:ankyrin repeat protein